MRFLSTLLTLPIALVVVLFATSNKDLVTLKLFPLPFRFDAPLYALVLGSIVLGFMLGGFVVWNADRRYRRQIKEERRRADQAERERQQVTENAAAFAARPAGEPASASASASAAVPAPALPARAQPPKRMYLSLRS